METAGCACDMYPGSCHSAWMGRKHPKTLFVRLIKGYMHYGSVSLNSSLGAIRTQDACFVAALSSCS